MYKVPMDMPAHCNKCPFGHCAYSFPFGNGFIGSISRIDGKENNVGTYGYVCNVDSHKNGRYTAVMRAAIGNDIPKPGQCGLEDGNNV